MPNNNRPCTCVLNPSTSQISCSFSTSDFYGGYITLTKAITKVDLKGEKGNNGESGTSPYISYLTNEAQTFAAGTAKEVTTQLYAYQGTTEKNVQIKSVNGVTASTSSTATGKTGMNFYVNSTSSVAHPEITFSATTLLPQTQTEQLEIKYIISGENTERSVYFSYSSTTTGSSGAAASLVDITASSQMFKSIDGGVTFSPNTIVLTPRFQTVTYSKWQYSQNGGSSWTDITSGQHGLTISNGVLAIAKTCDLFTDSITTLSFKCVSSNANVFDTITIVKLYDTTDIDIDVGGRNLVTESTLFAYPSTSANWISTLGNTINENYTNEGRIGKVTSGNFGELQFEIILDNFGIQKTDKVTFSLDVKLLPLEDSSKPDVSDYVYLGYSLWDSENSPNWYTGAQLKWDATTAGAEYDIWRRLSITFPGYTGSEDYKRLRFGIIAYANQANSDIRFITRNMKIELGNVATDWTIAPEETLNNTIINIVPFYFYTTSGLRPDSNADWVSPLDETKMTDPDYYVWQRNKIIYGNGENTWSEIYSIKNKIGFVTEYASSESENVAPEIGWSEDKPTNTSLYIWTRTRTDWDTGLVTYSEPICDTLTKQLQDGLTANGDRITQLSTLGFVRIFDNFIYLVDKEDMNNVSEGILMGSNGIQYFYNASGWNQTTATFSTCSYTSVWSLDGTMDLSQLNAVHIKASEIEDGILTLGKTVNTEGHLEVYKTNGTEPIVKIDGNGVEVKLVNGGWARILDTNGITLVDANNNLVFGSDTNLDRFNMTKATVSSELNFDSKIIAQPASLTVGSVTHHGLAFVRGG